MPSQLEVDSSVRVISHINGLFNRCFKYGYCLKVNTVEDLIESANYKLFKNSQNQQHCLHPSYLQFSHKNINSGLMAYLPDP